MVDKETARREWRMVRGEGNGTRGKGREVEGEGRRKRCQPFHWMWIRRRRGRRGAGLWGERGRETRGVVRTLML